MSISGEKKRTENGKKRRLIRHCKQNETSSNFFSLFFFWSKNFWESSYRVCFLRKQTRIESLSFLIGEFFWGLWGSPKMSLFLFFLHWKNTVFFGFLLFTLELTLKNGDVFGEFFWKKRPPLPKKKSHGIFNCSKYVLKFGDFLGPKTHANKMLSLGTKINCLPP